MTPLITLSRSLTDPALFGRTFSAPSFWPWRTLSKVIDGIALTEPREIELFMQCTGRTQLPIQAVRRLILLAGRRAGKDRFMSAVAVWRAALCADWRKYQSAGEGAVVILLGADKKQARILRDYCEGLLRAPLLAREVKRSLGELIEFRNGATLEITTNDARLVRGRSAIAVLGSECCHWQTDEHSASSDEEVVAAAEPSMAMCPDGGILMLGSSVYRRRGFMYRQFKELHGNADAPEDTLCWFAPSGVMNPRLPQHVIDGALAQDVARARAEFLNVWREDLSDFLPLDAVDACITRSVYELPPHLASNTSPSPIVPAAPARIRSRSRLPIAASPASSTLCASASRALFRRRSSPSSPRCSRPTTLPRCCPTGTQSVFTPTSGGGTASSSSRVSAPPAKIICPSCRCYSLVAFVCSTMPRCVTSSRAWSVGLARVIARLSVMRRLPRPTTTSRPPLPARSCSPRRARATISRAWSTASKDCTGDRCRGRCGECRW